MTKQVHLFLPKAVHSCSSYSREHFDLRKTILKFKFLFEFELLIFTFESNLLQLHSLGIPVFDMTTVKEEYIYRCEMKSSHRRGLITTLIGM